MAAGLTKVRGLHNTDEGYGGQRGHRAALDEMGFDLSDATVTATTIEWPATPAEVARRIEACQREWIGHKMGFPYQMVSTVLRKVKREGVA